MLRRVLGKERAAADRQVNVFGRHGAFFGQAMHENGDGLVPALLMEAV